jgi:hypothetical protein
MSEPSPFGRFLSFMPTGINLETRPVWQARAAGSEAGAAAAEAAGRTEPFPDEVLTNTFADGGATSFLAVRPEAEQPAQVKELAVEGRASRRAI